MRRLRVAADTEKENLQKYLYLVAQITEIKAFN